MVSKTISKGSNPFPNAIIIDKLAIMWYTYFTRKGDVSMYTEEINREAQKIWNSIKNAENELISLKIAIHNLEKLGFNMDKEYKQLDKLEIEMYKMKKIIKKEE